MMRIEKKGIGVLWLALLLIVGFTGATALFIPGTMQEDALITARYARNLADGNGFVFNLDEKVLGTTAPGWALFSSPIFILPVSLHTKVAIFQLLCFFLFYLGLFRLGTSSLFRSNFHSACYFVIMALHPAMRHAAVAGMETSGLVFLSVELWRAMQELKKHNKSWIKVGFLSFLVVAMRLDAVFICLAFAGVYISKNIAETRVLKASAYAAGLAGGLTLFFLFSLKLYFGQWIPQSMLAKTSWSYVSGVNELSLLMYIDTVKHLLWFNFPWPRVFYPEVLNGTWMIVTMSFFLFAYYSGSISDKARSFAEVSICYIALYTCFLFFGRASVFPWYGHLAIFLFQSSLVAMLLTVRWTALLRKIVLFFLFAVSAGTGLFSFETNLARIKRSKPELIEIGEYLRNHGAKTLMTEPIGYIGFYSNVHHVYDLAGLVDRSVFLLRRTGKPGWFFFSVKKFKPEFVILRKGEVEANLGWNIGVLFRDDVDLNFFEKNYTRVSPIEYTHYPERGSLAVYRRIG